MYRKNLINLLISYFGLAVGLFNTLFKPRILTAEEIGIFSTIISLTFLTQIFTFGGTLSVLMKFYPEYKDTPEKDKFVISVISFSYLLLGTAVIILFMLKKWILLYYDSNSLNEYFIYLPLYLVISHTVEICERLSRILFVSVKSNIIRNVYFRFLNFSFLIYMYLTGTGFGTYMIFFISLNSFTVLQLIVLSVKNLKIKWSFKHIFPDLSFLKKFSSYAFFMMISSLSGVITANIDKIMIGHYLSLSKTGVYSIALAITTTLNIIFESFSRIAQPKIAESMQSGRTSDLKSVYYDNLYSNIFFGVIAYVLLCVFSQDILTLLGKEYGEAGYVIILIASGLLFNLNSGMCGEMIALSEFYRFDFYSRIVLIFIVIGSNMIFIPAFGITGAALATASNYVLYDIIKMIYAYRKFGIHPFTLRSLSFYVSGAAVALLLISFKDYAEPDLINIVVISIFSFVLYDLILGYVFGYCNSLLRRLYLKYGKSR